MYDARIKGELKYKKNMAEIYKHFFDYDKCELTDEEKKSVLDKKINGKTIVNKMKRMSQYTDWISTNNNNFLGTLLLQGTI
jgi:hypothetical protein